MNYTVATYGAIYQGLDKSFQKGIEEYKVGSFGPVMEKIPSSSSENLYVWLDHIPGMKELIYGTSRTYRNVARREYKVANRDFENTIEILKKDVEDDRLNSFGLTAKMMGREAAMLPDQLIGDVFDGGFASVTGYDGQYWFSDSHTVGITTLDNKRTATLTATSYGEALAALYGFTAQPDKDSPSRPLNPMVKAVLVVPPALMNTGRALVMNERDAAGATNTYYKTAELLVSPYLTSSSTAWFLVNVAGGIAPVVYQERQAPTLFEKTPATSDRAFNYRSLIWGIEARGAALPTFPWLAIGSTGLVS